MLSVGLLVEEIIGLQYLSGLKERFLALTCMVVETPSCLHVLPVVARFLFRFGSL